MHVIMVKRGNLYLERSAPRYNLETEDVSGAMLEGVGVVEGEVSAVSHSQFYLRLKDGKLQEILQGELEMPTVGTIVSVTYAGGRPPKALLIKTLIGPPEQQP